MRVATFVVGLIGGVVGIIMGLFAMAAGGLGVVFGAEEGSTLVALGISAIGAAILGIICASIYFGGRSPRLMAFGLLVSGIWHFISISGFAIPGGGLLVVASVLGLMGRKAILRARQ